MYAKLIRSSRPEVFCKKGVLKNFAQFTGKHLCQGLFFNKVAGLRLYSGYTIGHILILIKKPAKFEMSLLIDYATDELKFC